MALCGGEWWVVGGYRHQMQFRATSGQFVLWPAGADTITLFTPLIAVLPSQPISILDSLDTHNYPLSEYNFSFDDDVDLSQILLPHPYKY